MSFQREGVHVEWDDMALLLFVSGDEACYRVEVDVSDRSEVWLRVEELDGSITRVELERCIHTSTPRPPRLGG